MALGSLPIGDRALAAQASPNLGFYAVVLPLAFLAPEVAAFGFLAIAAFAILRGRGGSAGARLDCSAPTTGGPPK